MERATGKDALGRGIMLGMTLKVLAVIAGFLSAACWLYAGRTILPEQELKRRRRVAERTGQPLDLGGVNLIDGGVEYDLIATLRHQSTWNRNGAIFAAVAISFQTIDLLLTP